MVIMTTLIFIGVCLIISLSIGAYAWFNIFNKKDGFCDVLEERGSEGTEHLVVAKSNIAYKYLGRVPGKPDSQKVSGYKPFKPIDSSFSLPWLSKKTNKMYIFKDKDGLMHPMLAEWDAKTKQLKLKPDYRETIDWLVNEFHEKDKIKEKLSAMDKFLQYAPPVAMMMMLVFGAIMWWQHENAQQEKYTAAMLDLNVKIANAAQTYNPAIMQKAAQIVSQYELERGTINWTQTIVQGNGIQVNT